MFDLSRFDYQEDIPSLDIPCILLRRPILRGQDQLIPRGQDQPIPQGRGRRILWRDHHSTLLLLHNTASQTPHPIPQSTEVNRPWNQSYNCDQFTQKIPSYFQCWFFKKQFIFIYFIDNNHVVTIIRWNKSKSGLFFMRARSLLSSCWIYGMFFKIFNLHYLVIYKVLITPE